MSVSEVSSRGPKDQAISREAEAGAEQGSSGGMCSPWSGRQEAHDHLWPPTPRMHPPLPAVVWPGSLPPEPTQCPQEVACSAQGVGNVLWGRGHRAAWKTEQGVGESRRQKFDPELSGAGAEGGGARACCTRDAPRSWVALSLSSLLEGLAAALPGHAQTRACPVDFRPGGLLCGIAALVLARLVQTRSL